MRTVNTVVLLYCNLGRSGKPKANVLLSFGPRRVGNFVFLYIFWQTITISQIGFTSIEGTRIVSRNRMSDAPVTPRQSSLDAFVSRSPATPKILKQTTLFAFCQKDERMGNHSKPTTPGRSPKIGRPKKKPKLSVSTPESTAVIDLADSSDVVSELVTDTVATTDGPGSEIDQSTPTRRYQRYTKSDRASVQKLLANGIPSVEVSTMLNIPHPTVRCAGNGKNA